MNNTTHLCELFSSIQGEGYLVGRRQIFIRFPGCNMECRYCDTDHSDSGIFRQETAPGSSEFHHLQQPVALDDILVTIEKWIALLPGTHHSISVTGGEPLLHVDILNQWLPKLRRLLPIHLETNGTLPAQLAELLTHLDYISMDMKLPSASGCGEDIWELHRQFLEIAHSSQVSVKIVAGNTATAAEISKAAEIISQVDRNIPLFIQPLTLLDGRIGISVPHLLKLQELASTALHDVRVVPQMHKLLGAL
ncbi:MAG: radical SAM protein [Geobacteraceae bacterium GWC2_48_7]|nr:MAG: radical SAM protein [Geobacteraceae bacterium GWC2_48_7]